MSNIETLLNDEIQEQFGVLKDMQLGSDEYQKSVADLTKLCDRAIELEKFRIEQEDKRMKQAAEDDLKIEQLKEDKIDRKVKNGIAIAGIIVPTVVTIWGTVKSIKFEETGTITTIMGRGFINKLLPKK